MAPEILSRKSARKNPKIGRTLDSEGVLTRYQKKRGKEMNFVHIIGRLGKDPETRYTADGLKVTVLTVATSSRKGNTEETIWWRVTLWGDRWDKMLSHLTKGKPVMVGGEMRKPELYTDKSGSPQISSIDLRAEYVKFVPFGNKNEQGEQQRGGEQGGEKASGYGANPSFGSRTEEIDFDEEPIPF